MKSLQEFTPVTESIITRVHTGNVSLSLQEFTQVTESIITRVHTGN